MIAQEWTISGLSVELDRDRRTIARAIGKGNVRPVREDGRAKHYRMADVVTALFATGGELDLEQERALLAREQSRKLKRENDVEEGKVIPLETMVDVLQQVSKQAVSILDALPLNIKRRVPQLKAKDITFIRSEIAKSRNAIANIRVGQQQ